LKKTKRRKKKEPCQSPISSSPLRNQANVFALLAKVCAKVLHTLSERSMDQVASARHMRRPEPPRKPFVPGLYDLLSQMAPIGSPYKSAGEGACREGHDLVDLAARDFDFHGGVEEIG
jgi:hypothetical protein